jgi:WD40 repeat protein/serine/threonine protein kinase/tetratricopeptide (TPR) repeat protein
MSMVGTYTESDEPVPGFRLTSLLGWGRFGEVWKAAGPGGITVAVKIIPLNNCQGLKEFRAIRLVKQIRHPNLVPILAFWLKDRQGNFIDDSLADDETSLPATASELIIVMGLGDKSLYDRLHECQREGRAGIPLEELLGYMEDAARAIDFLNRSAHLVGTSSVGIQHCDIKPHNILVVSGVAQVCDLGVARVLEDTRVSAATGSAAYIAPEFIKESKPSKATDQYSLAVSYIELRTGTLPFLARTAAAAYLVHLNGDLDLSILTASERTVLSRASNRDPDKRFPTCSAFVKELELACAQIPPEERAIIDGIARLNASGLIAGCAVDPEAKAGCFGPHQTATVDGSGESLAISDELYSEQFATTRPRRPNEDEVATAVCRSLPVSAPNQPSGARSRLALGGLALPMNARFWRNLKPTHRRYLRYAGQLALLMALGVVAGQMTSSFHAAERKPPAEKSLRSENRPANLSRAEAKKAAEARYAKVLALRSDGRYADALSLLDKEMAENGPDGYGLVYRAGLEIQLGQSAEALADTERATDSGGPAAAIQACRAEIFLQKGEYRAALEACDRASSLDPKNATVTYLRSQALTGWKQFRMAADVFRQAYQHTSGQVYHATTGLGITPAGQIVATTAGRDRRNGVRIWQSADDKTPATQTGGPTMALSPDGSTMALGSEDNAIHIVDLAKHQTRLTIPAGTRPATALAFCHGGEWIAAGNKDGSVSIWNCDSGSLMTTLTGHQGSVTCLAYREKSGTLASGGVDRTVRVWDVVSGACKQTVAGHQATVNAVAISNDGKLLASGASDKLVKVWDIERGSELQTLTGHTADVTCLAFGPDDRQLASGSADLLWPDWPGQIKIWETGTGKSVTTFGGHPHGVYQLAFDRASGKLASAGTDWQIRWWGM